MTRNRWLPAALFGGAMLVAAPAFAQAPAEEEASEDAADEGAAKPAAPVEATAEEAAVMRASTRGTAKFPRIADDQETIFAVQRKAYLLNRKFEVTPMATASFTDRFVQTFGGSVSLSYHLAENFGLELVGSLMFPNESGLTDEILREGKLTPEIAKLTQMMWATALGAQWSPIYGKLQIFDASLGTFAFYIGVGIGVGQTRVQCTPATPLDPAVFGDGATCRTIEATGSAEDAFQVVYEPNRTQLMGSLVGGVRFNFSNSIGLKFEVRDWLFPARVYRPGSNEPTQRYTDAIRNNLLVNLGVSFLFGGEDN
jgi:outer membrane beta-barrel protein